MKSALDAAAEQVSDPSSDLYHHRVQLKGAAETAHGGWVVRLADRTSGRPVCVSIATTAGAVTPTTNLEFTSCAPRRAGSGTSPAPPV